ncbi:hypothetical protein WHR41_07517 [Cladosporium halotolerans]|uniref:Calponin-homology (CH) domain-containing protein n=1 Tax=Cladosporium halotolerans TaxID=1052096 RepID=A0AB34KIH0_9PEZI
MPSVTSLDSDMRNLRLSRYTPQAANEARSWIEDTLGRSLPPGDLLAALKDGVALCELANLALPPPGIKFKKSQMPFIQMENISHFLKACEMPPLNMPSHDRFLTVDLFEGKDPAQVLQCLGAFSRQANAANPSTFRSTIGPKKSGGTLTPSASGTISSNASGSMRHSPYGRPSSPVKPSAAMPSQGRAISPALTGGSNGSQSGSGKNTGPVSSWSSKADEGVTAPAWNIAQYGFMGGASQGNQGISFGARRQITSQSPTVPSFAEKERKRKEKEEEEARLKQQSEENEHKRRVEREAEEEREKAEEERRWEEETQRHREEERRRVEAQKRQWAEQERRWQRDDEERKKEDAEIQHLMKKSETPGKPASSSSSILRGQSLADYQREQRALGGDTDGPVETPEGKRVRELEKQLEEARERERQYQAEREEKLRSGKDWSRPGTAQTDRPSSAQQSEASWTGDEREYLRGQWQANQDRSAGSGAARQGETRAPPSLPSRPLPEPEPVFTADESLDEPEERPTPTLPTRSSQPLQISDSSNSMPHYDPSSAPTSSPMGSGNRPLPSPQPKEYEPYSPPQQRQTRTETYLSANPAPKPMGPRVSASAEAGDTALEQAADRDRRIASQQKTNAGGWASKSLLEREMERERERQREWEREQKETADRKKDPSQGSGEGQSWDVNQYGYTGGDSMNRGSSSGSGIAMGGRRQIIGPRPQK